MRTYADLIKTATSARMGDQIRLARHEVGDDAAGMDGTLLATFTAPRMGMTSLFILWDDRDEVSEYRIGPNMDGPVHWTNVRRVYVDFATEDPRVAEARVQVGEMIAEQARRTMACVA